MSTKEGRQNAREFSDWVESNRQAFMQKRLDEFRAALEDLACWDEGDMVTGRFDEPGSAQLAREVLAKGWTGPCVHGRDPFDRCDECADLPEEVAMARARGAK